MCRPVSWWIVCHGDERKLLISDNTDSHHEAQEEFGIKDDGTRRVAAGEFWPDPEKPSPDTATWKLIWDYMGNSRKPEWLDIEGEDWLRRELEKRCKAFVFVDGDHELTSCRAFLFGTARTVARKSSSVVARGSSRVEAWGSSSVEARDSSSVVARDSSRVEARDSSSVEAWGSSSVEAWGSSRVEARDSSSVEAWGSSRVVAWGSSHVEARDSSSVVARGSSRVVAWGSSHVEARDSSSVVAWDSSRVVAWGSSHVVALGEVRVVVKSKYGVLIFRQKWDGNGYLPVYCDHKGAGTYKAVETGYEVVPEVAPT